MWLPGEVWTLVFGHLALSDRLRVRATCKHFRDLVDNDLWRDRTLELRRSYEEYEEHFWEMIRHWRVTSAWLYSNYKWPYIAKLLPGLTTLKIDNRYFLAIQLQHFRSLTSLERLYIAYLRYPIDLDELSLFMPPRLRHLALCHHMFDIYALPAEIPTDSPFKKLKSFTFHCFLNPDPVKVLHFLVSSLPQLQHLSLSMFTETPYRGSVADLPPLQNCSLSSLELEHCKPKNLPMDLMKMLRTLTFLRSLAIVCLSDFCVDNESSKLSSWLKDLPALSSLVVTGAHVGGFVQSIPASVTRLVLLPMWTNCEAMTALSTQLPNLRHLHLQPLLICLGSDTALIPQLFPRLHTLRVLFKFSPREQVSEDDFLSLASLKELEVLEIVDEEPPPAALISKLRVLTNNRVRIYNRAEEDQLRSCDCTSEISSDSWI